METAISSKEKLSFIIEGPKSVWKLLGIHPRFGPNWGRVTEDNEEGTHEITGSLGDISRFIPLILIIRLLRSLKAPI